MSTRDTQTHINDNFFWLNHSSVFAGYRMYSTIQEYILTLKCSKYLLTSTVPSKFVSSNCCNWTVCAHHLNVLFENVEQSILFHHWNDTIKCSSNSLLKIISLLSFLSRLLTKYAYDNVWLANISIECHSIPFWCVHMLYGIVNLSTVPFESNIMHWSLMCLLEVCDIGNREYTNQTLTVWYFEPYDTITYTASSPNNSFAVCVFPKCPWWISKNIRPQLTDHWTVTSHKHHPMKSIHSMCFSFLRAQRNGISL